MGRNTLTVTTTTWREMAHTGDLSWAKDPEPYENVEKWPLKPRQDVLPFAAADAELEPEPVLTELEIADRFRTATDETERQKYWNAAKPMTRALLWKESAEAYERRAERAEQQLRAIQAERDAERRRLVERAVESVDGVRLIDLEDERS